MTSKPAPQVSVRRLLFRWLLLPLASLLALNVAVGYQIALYPAKAAYDWALMDTALSLSRLMAASGIGSGIPLSRSADILLRTDQYDRIYYSVHDAKGALLAGDYHLTPPQLESMTAGELLYDSVLDNENIRVAALRFMLHGKDAVVQVAETTVKRSRLTNQILTGLIASEMLLVVAVIILVWFGIGKGLAPLERLRAAIEARSHRDLRPVPEDHAPVEVQPVVHALNNLLGQLEGALQSQQQFIANAAHQLRTPLAGLRTQVEYGLQQRDPEEWHRILQALKPATERTAHLANQLLTLARAEVGAHQMSSRQPLDLRAVVESVAGDWLPQTIARDIDLGLELNPAPVLGDALLIGELLANLIDNAIRYTASGGRITVHTRMENDCAVLEVEDEGAGIPEAEREKVFQRFHRVDGSLGEGCGLGLAIVQEIAHLHGGHAEIRTPASGAGTLVMVRFPSAQENHG
ncbi:MAG: sensor histidine kinase N-terminal domain-containing protein [Burkholderiales bacterium]|nr:sensor histidine kinase N-terminal domain-containing protein [Burkholderiales bacterium]